MSFGTKIGFFWLCFLVMLAIFAPWIAPQNPLEPHLENRLHFPQARHWLGTDALGRDLLSRMVYGTRISLLVGVASASFAFLVGVGIGLFSGFYGGWLDQFFMGIMDVLLAFPSLLLAIAIVAILGPSLINAAIAIGIVMIPLFARLTRSQVLKIKALDYIEAARALGSPNWRILLIHIFPNSLGILLVQMTLACGTSILDLAGLSFLGLGTQPPTPEWGSMLSDTIQFAQRAPWTIVFPGIMITTTVLAFNLTGDGLRDLLDPRILRNGSKR